MEDRTMPLARPQRRKEWIGRLSYGSGAGRHQEKRVFHSKAAMDAWELERRTGKAQGMGPTPKATIGTVLDRWLKAQELKGSHRLRERTLQEYRRYVAGFPDGFKAVRVDRSPEVCDAVTDLVLTYKRRGRDGDLRSADQHAVDVLRIAFRWAAERGHLLARNPLRDLDLPQASGARHELPAAWKDPEQVSLFRLEATRLRYPYANVVLMGMHHAPRMGEILGLEWPQVMINPLVPRQSMIQIVQDLSRRTGAGQEPSWQFDPPKSRASRRTIPLVSQMVEALVDIQTCQLAAKRVLGAAYGVPGHPGRDLVFCHEDGHPIDARAFLRRQFHPLCDRVGMPRIRFHQLRHVWATRYLASGGNPKTAQALLGHSTTAMVMEIYAQAVPDAQAVDVWGA